MGRRRRATAGRRRSALHEHTRPGDRALSAGFVLGVCSWSLRPRDAAELAERVLATGLARVSLHLDPLRRGDLGFDAAATRRALERAGVTIASGMMSTAGEDYSTLESIRRTGGLVPDATWPENEAAAHANAALAAALGIRLVTLHAGFVPADAASPARAELALRVARVARAFAAHGVALALETGQEDAPALLRFLGEVERAGTAPGAVGLNFDPANLLLYGTGDPIESLRLLLPHVRGVHVKDARRSAVPGTWGEETVVGEGEVDWRSFLALLRGADSSIELMVEREAGDRRVEDVRRAAELVRSLERA